jgi:hypothetical protein
MGFLTGSLLPFIAHGTTHTLIPFLTKTLLPFVVAHPAVGIPVGIVGTVGAVVAVVI